MQNLNFRIKRLLLPAVLSFGLSLPVLAQGSQDGPVSNAPGQNGTPRSTIEYRYGGNHASNTVPAQIDQSRQGGILRKTEQTNSGQEHATVGLYDSPALASLDNDLNDPDDTDNATYGVMFWIAVFAIVAAMLGLILFGMMRTRRSASRV